MTSTPCQARSIASVRPTGPAPTIITPVSICRFTLQNRTVIGVCRSAINVFQLQIPSFTDEKQRQHCGYSVNGVHHWYVMPFVSDVLTNELRQERWRDHSPEYASQTEGYARTRVPEFCGKAFRS